MSNRIYTVLSNVRFFCRTNLNFAKLSEYCLCATEKELLAFKIRPPKKHGIEIVVYTAQILLDNITQVIMLDS